ncbi:Immunoglobulin E-set [Sesbania bispinosa]|nr:Immunoglobulin E-set [Sesbania bispinosa]
MLQRRFSIFGGGDSRLVNNNSSKGEELLPTLKLETDRQVYKPGDPVIVTIQISNPSNEYSFLMERLSFEIKGTEKLDTQWFVTQKPLPPSKQRRGEHVFLDSSTPILVANQIVNAGASKSYVVRMLLPSIIPPSYKGSNIRYLYYVKSAVTGGWLILEHGQSRPETTDDVTDLEVRIPLQIWVNQKGSGFPVDDG